MRYKIQLLVSIWSLLVFIPMGIGQTARTGRVRTQPWQTSWDLFVDHLAMCEKRNTSCNELNGKAVTWEGVVDEVKTVNGKPLVYLRMTPKTFKTHGKVALADLLFPDLAPADVEKWEKIPKGTKVRFTTALTDISIFPTVGGELAVIISTKVVKLLKVLPEPVKTISDH